MSLNDDVYEIRDRIVRIESRLVQLGDHVGANLRSKQKITIGWWDDGPHVGIDALDVSVSRILAELRQASISTGSVPVHHDARVVFTIHLNP